VSISSPATNGQEFTPATSIERPSSVKGSLLVKVATESNAETDVASGRAKIRIFQAVFIMIAYYGSLY
jgi:hypothetical protein